MVSGWNRIVRCLCNHRYCRQNKKKKGLDIVKVYEIPVEGVISLKLNKADKSTVVQAKMMQNREKVMILEPIVVEGRELNLRDEKDLIVDLIYEDKISKPLIWRNVVYKTILLNNKYCIAISDDRDGTPFNRRGNFRLDMDVKGVLNMNEPIVVHDVSTSGISFYAPVKNRKNLGDEIHVKFQGGYEDIKVRGEIVREVANEDRNLYGCKIQKNMQIEKFMIEEQRRRISHKKK